MRKSPPQAVAASAKRIVERLILRHQVRLRIASPESQPILRLTEIITPPRTRSPRLDSGAPRKERADDGRDREPEGPQHGFAATPPPRTTRSGSAAISRSAAARPRTRARSTSGSRPATASAKHVDTAEETQYILSGSGDLLLDDGAKPIKPGDVFVLNEGVSHDLHNTGSDELCVLAFFSKPKVEQHWDVETCRPTTRR